MKNWLQQALDDAHMTQADLGREMTKLLGRNIDRAAANKLVNLKRRLQADELFAVVRITGAKVPQEYLDAVPAGTRLTGPNAAPLHFGEAPITNIPVRGDVAAGLWMETPAFVYDNEISDFVEGLAVAPALQRYTYGLRVRGTSINKIAPEGAVLVCLDISSGVEVHDRDLVIVERVRDQGSLREVTAKRLLRQNGTIVLMPESNDPLWQTPITINGEHIDNDETRIVAKVKHIITKP